ncbi:hypothetical protein Q7C36_022098 [Tachysurus vachellii]|uniref:Uncharacterized protein n=1 Tax=Tachysurus vachellii TaxID=175792 RepID=A0AA88IK77_TACVA|nr:hypothetical protein Q7C36_022098 [Tachysurus vachellii]
MYNVPPFRQRYSQSPHLLMSPFLCMHCHIQMSQEPLCQSTLACREHVGRAHGADVSVVPVPNRPTGPLVLNAVLMALRSALRSQRN